MLVGLLYLSKDYTDFTGHSNPLCDSAKALSRKEEARLGQGDTFLALVNNSSCKILYAWVYVTHRPKYVSRFLSLVQYIPKIKEYV